MVGRPGNKARGLFFLRHCTTHVCIYVLVSFPDPKPTPVEIAFSIMHTYMHTCTHTHTLTHAYTHTCIHTHTHAHTCMHTHTHAHTHAHIHTQATSGSVTQDIVISCPPSSPPYALRALYRYISQRVPATCQVHVHSSASQTTSQDMRRFFSSLECAHNPQLKITLIWKSGKSERVRRPSSYSLEVLCEHHNCCM